MNASFYIGEWFVEPQLNRVIGPAGSVSLEPRTMRVLIELAKHKHQVVTRDQLLNTVWEDSVVTEHSLTIAISDLRKLFGDDPKSPAIIETIRGVGYRLISEITDQPTPVLSISHQGDGLAISGIPPSVMPPLRKRKYVASLAAVLLFLILVFARPHLDKEDGFVIHSIQPLTTMSGAEISPAFSPDSRRVAFVAFPDSGDISQIFVQQLGVDTPIKLTDEIGAELMPTWSPDGQYIAYLSYGASGCMLVKKPSFGGAAIKLRDINCRLAGMTWAADGRSIVLSSPDEQSGVRRLYQLTLHDLSLLPLTKPPQSIGGDVTPRFSPDGSTLAFLRNIDGSTKDIYLIRLEDEEANPIRLTHDNVNITGFDWTADGQSIVFASSRASGNGLWRINIAGNNQPRLIRAVSVDDPGSVILARSGNQLVYTDWTYEVNTWRMPVEGTWGSDAEPLIKSTRADYHPAISRQQLIAFVSSRTGSSEIWTSDLAGNNQVKLTNLQSQATHYPSWSPDGKKIAFESSMAGQRDIYIIDSAGGVPENLTQSDAQESRPSWAHDGKSIYFGSDRSGSWQLWRKSLEGGELKKMTHNGAIAGWESFDGKALFYLRPDTTGIWKTSLIKEEGSVEEEMYVDADPSFVVLTEAGLYYLKPQAGTLSLSIERYDFQDASTSTIAQIPIRPIHVFARWGLAVSPDEKWVFFGQVDKSESDLMLTEGVL